VLSSQVRRTTSQWVVDRTQLRTVNYLVETPNGHPFVMLGVTMRGARASKAGRRVVVPRIAAVPHTTVRGVAARAGPLSLRPQPIQKSQALGADAWDHRKFMNLSASQILDCEEASLSQGAARAEG
jgi:hypothetical protein